MSVTSSTSHTTASSRKSRLPKCSSQKIVATYGGDTNVRVVSRIRPIAKGDRKDSRVVFVEEEGVSKLLSFFSPTRSDTNTRRQSSDSLGSVASLTAKFSSPNSKPLMPSTDACTASTGATKLFSPSNAKTPIHTNVDVGRIVPVRQSFIQAPSGAREMKEMVEKCAAVTSKVSQSIIVGDESFDFDAVSPLMIVGYHTIACD